MAPYTSSLFLGTLTPACHSLLGLKQTRMTKGAGSKVVALATAYKLLITAQERWRAFNGHELITDVLDGATFKDV